MTLPLDVSAAIMYQRAVSASVLIRHEFVLCLKQMHALYIFGMI